MGMVGYPFDNWMVVNDSSNQLVVKEVAMTVPTGPIPTERPLEEEPAQEPQPERVRRHVDIEASPEEVFEALATEEGRERWLDEPARQIHVESVDPPTRLVWWWASDDEPATRVDFEIVELPSGTRVVVTESAPSFPLPALAARFEMVLA
jgi:Activator of Hsp90 ATPase homolog 1-like protein